MVATNRVVHLIQSIGHNGSQHCELGADTGNMVSELGHLLFGSLLFCVTLSRPRVGLGQDICEDLVGFFPSIRDHRVGRRLGGHEDTTDDALILDRCRVGHRTACLSIDDLILKVANRGNDVIEKIVNLIEVITSEDC